MTLRLLLALFLIITGTLIVWLAIYNMLGPVWASVAFWFVAGSVVIAAGVYLIASACVILAAEQRLWAHFKRIGWME